MESKKVDSPTEKSQVDEAPSGAASKMGSNSPAGAAQAAQKEAGGDERPRIVDRRRVHAEGETPTAEGAAEAGEGEEGAPRKPTYVEMLQKKVAVAEEKLKEHIERLEKESADFRARQERELERRTQEARKNAVSGFLAIADDMGRATAAAMETMKDPAKGQEALEALVQGVQMIQGRFFQELASLGVKPFVSRGEKFDPQRHEAIRMIEVTDPGQDGAVIEELCQGYMLGEEVLRPSQVIVGQLKNQ